MKDKPEFPHLPLRSGKTILTKTPAQIRDEVLAWSVVLALGLVVLVAVFLPRPAFQIDRVEFLTTACDPTSHGYQVTASMTIRNAGAVGGVASVHLLIDGHIAETGNYEVPAHQSIQRGLNAVVNDCQWHRFAVELFVEPTSG